MRLPIYRNLNRRLEIFGFSLAEITFLCVGFIVFSEIFSSVHYGSFFVFSLFFLLAIFFRFLHFKFEARYLEKFIRFVALPDGLSRKVIIFPRAGEKL